MFYDSRKTGALIRELRLRRGMSQEVLSGLAGIARSHLSMIETGAKTPTLETLCRVAAALDIRPSELLRRMEEEAGT